VVLVRLASALAGVVSAGLLAIVLVRDVGLNPLNAWTILLGFLAAALLWTRASNGRVLAAWIALLLAMLPALMGGLGLLFLPSLVLLPLAAALRAGSDIQPS
jgi:hypothetical protein